MDFSSHDFATITTTLDARVLLVTLNRPDKLNAWTFQMGAELRTAIVAANADEAIEAIVLTGAGRGFCAGADIEQVFDAQSKAEPPFKREARADAWVALVRASKPIIAAINGAAIGIGLTQVLPCDHIVCADDALLSLRFVKLGLVPELASSYFVVQRCGFGTASELMLTGRTIEGSEAASLGLVDRVVPAGDLLDTALAVARSMGENPQAALSEIKALLTLNGADSDLERVQAREFAALDRCYASAEHREAIDAFLEKRAPDFARARAG